MLTPIELQGTTLKSGFGYNKKDTDQFLEMVYHNYEELYKENLALKDKVENLNESVKHYKEIEKTLQKALVLAEQTSSDITNAAKKKAAMIEKDAKGRAQIILHDAKVERNRIQDQTRNLIQQYDKYRSQFKQLAASQVELLDSEGYQLTASFETDDSDPELLMDSEDDYSYFQDSAEKTSEEALETLNKVETLSAETRIFEKVNPRELNAETGNGITSQPGDDFEISLNDSQPGSNRHAIGNESDANVSSEPEAAQNSMFYEMAKQQEIAEQQEKERQRELEEQQERARQQELAEQQERERQQELAEQQERERQRELAEQQERARQRELEEQQERARQQELAEQQEKERQRELAEQQERARQRELEEQQERARQWELEEQQSVTPLHELNETENVRNNSYQSFAESETAPKPSVSDRTFGEPESVPKPPVPDLMFEDPMPVPKPPVSDHMYGETLSAPKPPVSDRTLEGQESAPKPPVPDLMFEDPMPAPKPSVPNHMFGEPKSTPRHSVPDMMYESQTASPYSSHRVSHSEQSEAAMPTEFSVEVKEVTASSTEARRETRSRFSESISPIPNSMEDDDEFEFLS